MDTPHASELSPTADFQVGDLVLDMREHNPCVGEVVRYHDLSQWGRGQSLEVRYSVLADHLCQNDFMRRDHIPSSSALPYGGKRKLGVRITRIEALDGKPDNYTRLPDGLTVFECGFCREKKSYRHDSNSDPGKSSFHEEDVRLSILDAFDLLNDDYEATDRYPEIYKLRKSKNDLNAQDHASAKAFLDRPFGSYRSWTKSDLDYLNAEVAWRKQCNDEWDQEVGKIIPLLVALGASVSVSRGDENDSWRPVYARFAVLEELADDLVEILGSFDCDVWICRPLNGDEKIEPGDDYAGYVAIEEFGADPPLTGGEPVLDYALRIRSDEGRLRRVIKAWKECKGDLAIFHAMTARWNTVRESVSFVVEGLFPKKAVSLLVGPAEIGKSTLMLQIAHCVAAGVPFCGLPVRQGKVIYLSGEDTEEIIGIRRTAMEQGICASDNLLVFEAHKFGSLENALKSASIFDDISLVIVDTVAAYSPRVNDAAPAREFMSTLNGFAISHNCAVAAIHHVNKDVSDKSADSLFRGIKGSGEFVNAARMVVTMSKAGPQRVLTIKKLNMPASVRRLHSPLRMIYDPATEIHVPVAPPVVITGVEAAALTAASDPATGALPKAAPEADPLADARIVAAVVSNAKSGGAKIARSGPREPFNLKAPELAGWSRDRVRAGHKVAIEAGLLDA